MKPGKIFTAFAAALALHTAALATPVQTVLLADFDSVLPSPTAAKATGSNSSIDGGALTDSFSAVTVAAEGGSNRLKITDAGGFRNGVVLTIPAAFSEPGFYLITADVKVDSTAAGPIYTYGMAAKVGAADSAKVLDGNAGYVLNLPQNPTNGAALGYQTIGAGIPVPAGGTFPKDLTLYFSTDPSGKPGVANSGDFTGSHRGSNVSFPTTSNSTAIYVDNIQRIGPGNFGEERHCWISIGDNYTNLTTLNNQITNAYNNGFNCIDILVRYRANRYYIANRNFNTYANPEPAASGVTPSNDPIQFAIDRAHELGMKVYGSFSCFLVTDGSTYPGILPSGSITYTYNGGSPAPQSGSGLWADVGRADVRNYTKSVVMDLVQNYDLDGIIFDRIRYDGNTYGYNPQALTEMGISGTPAPTNANFIQKRRDAVATFLHDCYVDITSLKPWMVVGTVPIAYGSGFYETYNTVFQSWPTWSATPTANRTITFGAQDCIQPQFYRMWDTASPNTAPAANETLMNKALYGDTANDPMDFGLMPGSNVNVSPLFYAESIDDTTDAANTAATLATNICDTRQPEYYMNGFGIYNARPTLDAIFGASVISRIRSATTPCGTDLMMPRAPFPDYLMKAGWDNTAPNAATATVSSTGYTAQLSWSTPPPAEDGEVPVRYLIYKSTTSDVKQYYQNLVNPATNITGNSYTDAGSAGTFYYRVVAVDDYNNRAASAVVGPVTLSSADVIVESRLSNGSLNTTSYSENPTMANTSSKSSAPGLSGSTTQGARYRESLPASATFTPNLPLAGNYNVFVTVGGTSNNLAKANYTINNAGTPRTGQVNLYYNDASVANNWKLLAGNVPFAAGSGGSITFSNVDGDGTGSLAGLRFVMDAVKFEFASSAVADWQLY